MTDIFMLDTTCLPYLCINSIKEQHRALTELSAAHQQTLTDVKTMQTRLQKDVDHHTAQLQTIERMDRFIPASTTSLPAQPQFTVSLRDEDTKWRRWKFICATGLLLLLVAGVVSIAAVTTSASQVPTSTQASLPLRPPLPVPSLPPPSQTSFAHAPSPPPPSPPFASFPPRWMNEQQRSLGFSQCSSCTSGGQNHVSPSDICECCNDGSVSSISYRLGYNNWTIQEDRFRALVLGSNGYYRLDGATCDYRFAESSGSCIGAGCDLVHGCGATVGYSSGVGMFCFVYECMAPSLGSAGCSFVVALDTSFAHAPSPPPPSPP